MAARPKNEARVYVRRSTSRQESGIFEQLNWALAEASKHSVRLDASAADLQHLLDQGLSHGKAIYLDDGISGSDLNRPGFVALRAEALANPRISHVFIHISDRFARPEQAVVAMKMEIDLLLAGITVVFMNRTSEPRDRGHYYFERDILLLHEYTQNGEFLNRLAVRVLQTQIRLAGQGFRTGGCPPYGFRRVLVDAQGNEIQELVDGTTMRREGCHVILKPHDPAKIQTWLYILHLYGEKHWGLMRICHHLNDLGIPAPRSGKMRRIQGRLQPCSGRWSQRTVTGLIRNAAIIGLTEYGKTLTGKHRRLSAEGPRLLDETDRRADGEARPVRNPPERIIQAPARYPSCAEPGLVQSCHDLLDQRGRSRRGISRCPDATRYPLATCLYDLTAGCGAVLYGRLDRQRPVYVCSRYMRSAARACARHAVDGEATLTFVLSVLRQRIQIGGGREALRARLQELAALQPQQQVDRLDEERQLAERRLQGLEAELQVIGRNLARAADERIFAVIQGEYQEKSAEIARVRQHLEQLGREAAPAATAEQEVEAALRLFDEIERVTSDAGARAEIPQLLRTLNVKLGLRFGEIQKGRKRVHVVDSGILTLGAEPQVAQKLVSSDSGDLSTDLPSGRKPDSTCFTIGKSGEPGAVTRHKVLP